MQIILATTRALNYGNQLAAKTHATLKSIAKLGHIPLLTGSHDGEQAGEVTGLKYQKRGDLGILLGTIKQPLPEGWGCSLQYEGSISGGRIKVQPSDQLHAAILPNPRDTMTVRDADGYLLFRDSESAETTTETATSTVDEATDPSKVEEPATLATEVEIDTDVLISSLIANESLKQQLIKQILDSPSLTDWVTALISERLTPPEPEVPKAKIVVKPKQPERTQVTTRPPRPIQQKLIPLA